MKFDLDTATEIYLNTRHAVRNKQPWVRQPIKHEDTLDYYLNEAIGYTDDVKADNSKWYHAFNQVLDRVRKIDKDNRYGQKT